MWHMYLRFDSAMVCVLAWHPSTREFTPSAAAAAAAAAAVVANSSFRQLLSNFHLNQLFIITIILAKFDLPTLLDLCGQICGPCTCFIGWSTYFTL
jgi:hypothetical protein